MEEDAHLVGSALVTYLPRAGVISTVAVDPRYRRRGFARALLGRSQEEIARSGRAHAVLEVLENNVPAQRLYRALGYRHLRSTSVLVREDPAPVTVPPPGRTALRAFRRSDAPPLSEVLNAQAPPAVREVLPAVPGMFTPPPFLARATDARSAAWVLALDDRPIGFVRATARGITRSANLTQPVLGPEVDAEAALSLVGTALAWIRSEGFVRTAVEVPEGSSLARATLAAVGFAPGYSQDTLVRDLLPAA